MSHINMLFLFVSSPLINADNGFTNWGAPRIFLEGVWFKKYFIDSYL